MHSNNYTVQVEKDVITGELVLPLPTELLAQMGWSEETDLFWIDNENGTFTLTEKKNESSSGE